MEYLIGVDLGTTATKAVLFQKDGTIVATSSRDYPLYRDALGMAEEDFMVIFDAFLAVITELTKKLTPQDDLLAVSFSTQMHSLIAFDSTWQPLTRLLTWADTRALAVAEQLKGTEQGRCLYQKTGTPIHPMSPLPKILWLKNERPATYQKASHYLELKGYLFWRLFGCNKIDLSTATGTGLCNLSTLDWDEEALAVLGLRANQLPEIVEPYALEQGINPDFARKMGLNPRTKFVWGAADGPLSNLGVNAIKPGIAALTIGTSGAIRVMAEQPQTDAQGRTFAYALDQEHWVIGGPVNSGGAVVRWLQQTIFHDQLSLNEISELAAQSPAGAKGLLFHPYLGGERAPIWQGEARGSFFGLNYEHQQADLARSVFEGILFNLGIVLQCMVELTGPIQQLQATGGFTRSKLWTQIAADIFEQQIQCVASREAGCLGAIVIAEKALGLIENLNCVEKMMGKTENKLPNKKNSAVYHELAPLYQHLSELFSQEYPKIAAIQHSLVEKEETC